MRLLEKIFQKKYRKKKSEEGSLEKKISQEKESYPYKELSQYLEKDIEIHYINRDHYKVKKKILKNVLENGDFIEVYSDKEKTGHHTIFWHSVDIYGHKDDIFLIKGPDDNLIYKNEKIEFRYDLAEHDKEKSELLH